MSDAGGGEDIGDPALLGLWIKGKEFSRKKEKKLERMREKKKDAEVSECKSPNTKADQEEVVRRLYEKDRADRENHMKKALKKKEASESCRPPEINTKGEKGDFVHRLGVKDLETRKNHYDREVKAREREHEQLKGKQPKVTRSTSEIVDGMWAKIEKDKRALDNLKKRREKEALKDATFKPVLSEETTNIISSMGGSRRKVHDKPLPKRKKPEVSDARRLTETQKKAAVERLWSSGLRSEHSKNKARVRLDQERMKECTFTPKTSNDTHLNNGKLPKSSIEQTVDRIFSQAQRYDQRRTASLKKKEKEEVSGCTFSPDRSQFRKRARSTSPNYGQAPAALKLSFEDQMKVVERMQESITRTIARKDELKRAKENEIRRLCPFQPTKNESIIGWLRDEEEEEEEDYDDNPPPSYIEVVGEEAPEYDEETMGMGTHIQDHHHMHMGEMDPNYPGGMEPNYPGPMMGEDEDSYNEDILAASGIQVHPESYDESGMMMGPTSYHRYSDADPPPKMRDTHEEPAHPVQAWPDRSKEYEAEVATETDDVARQFDYLLDYLNQSIDHIHSVQEEVSETIHRGNM